MAKLTILIFFIFGLAIFLFVKYALIGLRSAYDHVEKNVDVKSANCNAHRPLTYSAGVNSSSKIEMNYSEQILDLIDTFSQFLNIQAVRASYSYNNITNFEMKFKDDYSLGYIFGYLETLIKISNISYNNSIEIFSGVFKRIYGEGEGGILFEKATILNYTQNFNFNQGKESGDNDAIISINGNFNLPNWFFYLQNKDLT